MKSESMSAVMANRNRGKLYSVIVASAMVATYLLVFAAVHAANPGGSGTAGKSSAVKLESVSGSSVPRIILTEKSAKRLGIETGEVSMESIVRKQMVSGLIIPPMQKQPESKPQEGGLFGGFGKVASLGLGSFAPVSTAPAVAKESSSDKVWVLVTLSPAEWDRLAKDKPARLVPLATREKSATEVLAQPSGMHPYADMKRSMLRLYYKLPGKDHGLAVKDRVRVELQLSGSDEKQMVVPYSAVYYDAKGDAWVYVNEKPLTYERRRISVERVVGDLAVLSEGPEVGTQVVTVGAALLFGSEIFKK